MALKRPCKTSKFAATSVVVSSCGTNTWRRPAFVASDVAIGLALANGLDIAGHIRGGGVRGGASLDSWRADGVHSAVASGSVAVAEAAALVHRRGMASELCACAGI
ncbi:MAG: hypothetical protein JWR37_3465 [Mycobacterium sp.]|nr:hypothetical protein [Mycobacterium sp.]